MDDGADPPPAAARQACRAGIDKRAASACRETGDGGTAGTHLVGGLARPHAVDLDEVAHRDEPLDRLVVIQAVAARGPRGIDDAVAPFPRPDGRDRQPGADRRLLDCVHGLSTLARTKRLTSAGRWR